MKLSVKSDAHITGTYAHDASQCLWSALALPLYSILSLGLYPGALWAGMGVLVVVTGESMLRIFDLDEDDNYILHLDLQAQGASRHGDRAVSASFSNRTGRLAAGSRDGRVFLWQYAPRAFSSASGADNWEALPPVTLTEGVRSVAWGGTDQLLGVATQAGMSILSESVLCCSCVNGLAVMQQSAQRLYIEGQEKRGDYPEVLVPSINVKGCVSNGTQIVLWDGKDVEVRLTRGGGMHEAGGAGHAGGPC